MAIKGAQELRKELSAVKKGTVQPLYLLFGSEGYLVRTASEALVNAVAEAKGAEVVRVDAAGKPPEVVLQPAASLSLFASSQVIVVRGFTHLLSGDAADRLLSGLDSCLDGDSVLIFVAPADSGDKVDKRVKGYKGLAKRGAIVELNQQDPDELVHWLRDQAKTEGKDLTMEAAHLLLNRVGPDMQTLRMELDKALLFCLDTDRIDARDLEKLVGKSREDAVWSVAEAVARRNPVEAMELVNDLINGGTYPLVILTLIIRQFRHLLQARLLWEDAGCPTFRGVNAFRNGVGSSFESGAFGGGADDVTGIHPFATFKKFEMAVHHDIGDLARMMARLRQADRDAKTGAAAGPKEVLEELILDLCATARGRAA